MTDETKTVSVEVTGLDQHGEEMVEIIDIPMTIKGLTKQAIDNLVANLMYHDRLDDEELPRGAIQRRLRKKGMSTHDMAGWFREAVDAYYCEWGPDPEHEAVDEVGVPFSGCATLPESLDDDLCHSLSKMRGENCD